MMEVIKFEVFLRDFEIDVVDILCVELFRFVLEILINGSDLVV